jgi:hypothetical protein
MVLINGAKVENDVVVVDSDKMTQDIVINGAKTEDNIVNGATVEEIIVINGSTDTLESIGKETEEEQQKPNIVDDSAGLTATLERVIREVEKEAAAITQEMMDEGCEVNIDDGMKPMSDDSICIDAVEKEQFATSLQDDISKSLQQIAISDTQQLIDILPQDESDIDDAPIEVPRGELLEQGCKFLVYCVLRCLLLFLYD